MIQSRITSKAQVTLPRAVRKALGVAPGDEIAWEIEGEQAVVTRAGQSDPFVNNFAAFSEWASEADCAAFDDL